MFVVSNTSPISNLAIIGRLRLIELQFATVTIPEAVAAELRQLRDSAAESAIERAIREGWIECRPVTNHSVARLLRSTLDAGEAEAIALAIELSADLILLDEKDARAAAARTGIRITGVLGVLLEAKKRRHIDSVKLEIEKLRKQARFFVSSTLEEQVLAIAGE